MTTWNPIDAPIDRCLLGGYLTPGLCEVAGASSPRKWDEQAGYAMTGAILIYRGTALSRFALRFKLLTAEHWEEWAAIRPILLRPPIGQRAKALDVDHPQLNEVGITHLVVEDVTAPEQTEDGVWTIECKCIEWRRYGTALSKPDGADATPADPNEQRIGELSDEAQALKAARDKGNP
jgi:hypothetical protein